MKKHLLVILPHPDDESFGVAGLIALNRKEDIPVTYACLTLGEMGRNMGDPLFANRETLPLLRKQEPDRRLQGNGCTGFAHARIPRQNARIRG